MSSTPHKKPLACAGSWEEASVCEAQTGNRGEGVGSVGTEAATGGRGGAGRDSSVM